MKLIARRRDAATFCTGLFWSLAVREDLPKIAGGANSADVMGDVKNMSLNGVSYGALVICAAAFIVVVISCIGTYHETGEGKTRWFDFGHRGCVAMTLESESGRMDLLITVNGRTLFPEEGEYTCAPRWYIDVVDAVDAVYLMLTLNSGLRA
ncbi:DUF2976 domain-containing protein [Salmonella enterica]|nr:DUF2976 domain-containing protein [Salmonella enterica]